MNILGHASIALATENDDPAYVLGAVLPDIASMAGVRVDRSRLTGPLAAGVRLHLEADAVFHAHPEFLRGAAALRGDLAQRGVQRGPARAVGHAGWELLLDGTLLGSPAESGYWRALAVGEEALDGMSESDHPRWIRFLEHRDRRPALRYDDPSWVAERLYSMLARRPRLRLPSEQVPAVAEVLERHVHRVAAVAADVLAGTAAGVGRLSLRASPVTDLPRGTARRVAP
ncbi:MAG TPA: hypothetical protein VJM75_03030 [Acidimicrobiales bacterium]|nr:hypothetical protein [Acidimicrobiales bacterium]